MAKKSKVYKTKLLTDERGDVGFYTQPEEKTRPLPPLLAEPLQFDVAGELSKQDAAKMSRNKLAALRLEATTEAMLIETFSERWRRLHKHYKSDGSPKGWQKLAVGLARDFIPGLSIEYIYPSEKGAAKKQRDKLLVLHVAVELLRLREKGSKAGELGAFKALNRKWPAILGKQPKSVGALSTDYYRAKARTDLGLDLATIGVSSTKMKRRKA